MKNKIIWLDEALRLIEEHREYYSKGSMQEIAIAHLGVSLREKAQEVKINLTTVKKGEG